MVLIGIPYLSLVIPAIGQGLAGDWSTAYLLIEHDWHLVGLYTGVLICLILLIGGLYG